MVANRVFFSLIHFIHDFRFAQVKFMYVLAASTSFLPRLNVSASVCVCVFFVNLKLKMNLKHNIQMIREKLFCNDWIQKKKQFNGFVV